MTIYGYLIYKRGIKDMTEPNRQQNSKFALIIGGKEIPFGAIFMVIILPIFLSIAASFIYDKFITKNTTWNSMENFEQRLALLEKNDPASNDEFPYSINIEGGENHTINIGALEPVEDDIFFTNYISVEMASVLSKPSWSSNDEILKSPNTSLIYCAKDLSDEKILVKYRNGNQENYFYGQYNSNNQWDGNCIINVYENNNLKLVMEAEYNNGTLLKYQQVDKYTTKSGVNVWNISNRTINNNYTSGENWYYFRGENEYEREFNGEEVTPDDILTIQSFLANIDSYTWLEGYYSGQTSNGNFNDETECACMVKYFDDYTIRTLYVGNFKNGDFYSGTNNSWYITKEKNTSYMYYKGGFENGNPTRSKGYVFENPISQTRIDEILIENEFNLGNLPVELNWDVEE